MSEVSDQELLGVIKDFLEMGHVENIVAMFAQEPRYLAWSGTILKDERFAVRLGVSVLFEELKARHSANPEWLHPAIPALLPLLDSDQPLIRGEALSVLAIIDGPGLAGHIKKMLTDDDPQIREIAEDIMASAK
jgi:hypothetical protein